MHADVNSCPRRWGQAKFIDHGAISSGVLNVDYNGATGSLSAWDTVLQSTPEVSKSLMDRMERDFSNLAPQLLDRADRQSMSKAPLEQEVHGKQFLHHPQPTPPHSP